MKLKINKNLVNGTYQVDIAATDFTPEEKINISKFGSPQISIAPKFISRPPTFSPIRTLPVHSINNTFPFKGEEEADKFVSEMTQRVKTAMEELRQRKDTFSGEKEYEF